jgi:hypothetical protein
MRKWSILIEIQLPMTLGHLLSVWLVWLLVSGIIKVVAEIDVLTSVLPWVIEDHFTAACCRSLASVIWTGNWCQSLNFLLSICIDF